MVITGTNSGTAVEVHPLTGDIFLGMSESQNIKISGITTVVNSGSMEVRPVIYIIGQGIVRWIENQNTGKRLYLDLSISANEEVFFDFEKGTIMSTVRGNLLYTLLPGSDFRAFTLMPGENRVACLMYNDVGAIMQIGYTPQHWSADATQKPQS
jgi:hypothetical protein